MIVYQWTLTKNVNILFYASPQAALTGYIYILTVYWTLVKVNKVLPRRCNMFQSDSVGVCVGGGGGWGVFIGLKKERGECFNSHMVKHDIVVLACACWYMSMWTRMGNQSCFGTLQEVINSQDYCADTMISKVLHNSLCGEGWLNQSTWKGERDIRFTASCRGPSASLSATTVTLLCEEEGFEHQSATMLPWRQKQLVSDLVEGGVGENPSHDHYKYQSNIDTYL